MSTVPNFSARGLIEAGQRQLRAAGLDARHETEWLLAGLLHTSRLELYLRDEPVPEGVAKQFFDHLEARTAGTPLQYLLGRAEFFGRMFEVEPGVFIPRPETEAVVEEALRALRCVPGPLRLLDLGAGSGCIAVTLAVELPACVVVGVELSWEALFVARQNALRHGVAERVQFLQGRWTEPLRGEFDGLVANPPYVPSAQVDRLPLDVRQEPRLSLDGGTDGMRDLRRLVRLVPQVVRPGGIAAFECGEEQVTELTQLARASSETATVRALHDLAGRPRGMLMRLAPHGLDG